MVTDAASLPLANSKTGSRNAPVLVCITNIPTPYRAHFFARLARALDARGWKFEAWFMARSEQERYWTVDLSELPFEHRLLRGFSFRVPGAVLHTNPEVARCLAVTRPSVLIMAGSWAQPTNILAAMLARWVHQAKVVFWSESHLKSMAQTGPLTNLMRRGLLSLYDSFAVPGKLAREYIDKFASGRPTLQLANTVDELLFRDKVLELRRDRQSLRRDLAIPDHRRVLLMTARLSPDKGIVPFLEALASCDQQISSQTAVLIAGEGRLKSQIGRWINEHAALDVRLMGHLSEEDLLRLYAVADTFVLPSLRDPNPLAVVEALWAGLPLMLSDRVGNCFEALMPGENGWLFNTESSTSIKACLESWRASDDRVLSTFGESSSKIAEERFETSRVVESFLNEIISVLSAEC